MFIYGRMAPPMSKEQIYLLQKLYYDDGFIFGRDKITHLLKTKYPEMKISRRQVQDWLKKQEINQLHQQHREPKDIKATVLSSPNIQVGIDLIDMQNFEKREYKYILTGVDLFSRMMYAVPLKNKEDTSVLDGFEKMYKKIPDVKSIRSDNGSEFIANIFKDFLEKHYITQIFSKAHNPQSNGGIERFNQTLKRLIHKHIEMKNDYDWVKNIDKLLNNMNSTVIDGLGKTPNQIQNETGDALEETELKDKSNKRTSTAVQKFFKKDLVRIYQPSDKMKSKFWSEDVYEIEKIFKPRTNYGIFEYKLKEFNTRFKMEDLLGVPEVQNKIEKIELFQISKIVRPVVHNNIEHYEVAWKNYRKKSDNTIEPKEQLLNDIPKMINAFDKKHEVKFYKTKKGLMKMSWNELSKNQQ